MQVSDYMLQFRAAIDAYLPSEEPGRTTRLNLIGEYVARNKREIILYISHGYPDTATVVTRITYLLPASAEASRLFVPDRAVLPPHGPHFKTFDIAAGQTAQQFVESNIATIPGFTDWFSEDSRIRALSQVEPAGIRKTTMNNILIYWRNMRARVYDALYLANVRLPRSSSGTVRARTRSTRRSSRSTVASNAKAPRSSSGSGSKRSNYSRSNSSRRSSKASKSSPRPNSLSNHMSDPKP